MMTLPLRALAAIGAGLTVTAALALAPTAQAGDVTPDAATLEELPQCSAITQLDCQATVYNIRAGDQFVQVVNGAAQVSDVWPFRNPTAGPIQEHVTDTDMFPSGYDTVEAFYQHHQGDDWTIQNLREHLASSRAHVAADQRRIAALRAEVRRLRHKVHRLEH